MRIVGIESMIVEVPLKEPVTGVHGVTTVQKSVLVRVTSDDGVEGWGNVDPTPGYTLESVDDIAAGVERLAPALRGNDPFNVQRARRGVIKLPDTPGLGATIDVDALARYRRSDLHRRGGLENLT